jgi:hypothetical protein
MARNLRDMHELAAIFRIRGEQIEEATIRGLQSAAYRLEGMIPEAIAAVSPYAPEDTRELARSHYTDLIDTGARVGVDAPHAPFMEWGTRPHRPPMQPLADWAYRQGLVDVELDISQLLSIEPGEWFDDERKAFGIVSAIVGKIAKRGISPRHFMRSAVERLLREGILEEEIKAELAKVR